MVIILRYPQPRLIVGNQAGKVYTTRTKLLLDEFQITNPVDEKYQFLSLFLNDFRSKDLSKVDVVLKRFKPGGTGAKYQENLENKPGSTWTWFLRAPHHAHAESRKEITEAYSEKLYQTRS